MKGNKEKGIGLNDSMIKRADELDKAVYRMLSTMLQLDEKEVQKVIPIAIIREVLGFTSSVLAREGMPICNPYVNRIGDINYRCTLTECGCSKCVCQEEFMEQERIMGRINEAMKLNGLEVTDANGNKLLVREPMTNENFEIGIRRITETNVTQK